jgi:hypothetical protein
MGGRSQGYAMLISDVRVQFALGVLRLTRLRHLADVLECSVRAIAPDGPGGGYEGSTRLIEVNLS